MSVDTSTRLTPQPVIDIALKAFRVPEFGLDPCDHPQSLVPAHVKFTAERLAYHHDLDGWCAPWTKYASWGPVFLHPNWTERPPKGDLDSPWFHPLNQWVQKADLAAQKGCEIFAVLPAATGNAFFHDFVARRSTAYCLLRHRIKCLCPSDAGPVAKVNPGQAHMLVIWTPNERVVDRFAELLDDQGVVHAPG